MVLQGKNTHLLRRTKLIPKKEKQPAKDDEDPIESSSGLFYYQGRRIQNAGAVISIIFSAVLLVGAIVCLLLISNKSIHLRVGMIVVFTCLFAIVVGLLTNARRAEIFGATAA